MKNDIIRIENNVPDNYLIGSRDYQALLRLFTFGISSVKFDVDNIRYINDADYINSRLLNLLRLKVGFFTNEEFKDQYLREVLKVFSLIVKKKGTKQAIYDAINLYFRACRYNGDFVVEITNKDEIQPYTIKIGVTKESKDIILLEEILRYILPTGYLYEIFKYSTAKYRTNYYTQDMLTLSVIDDYSETSNSNNIHNNIHNNISNIFMEKSSLTSGESSVYYNVYNDVSDSYINILTYPAFGSISLYDGDFTVSVKDNSQMDITSEFDVDNANIFVLVHQYLKDKRVVCGATTWELEYSELDNIITARSTGFDTVTIDYNNFIRNLPFAEAEGGSEPTLPSSFSLTYENSSVSSSGFALQNDKRTFEFNGYSGNKLIIEYTIDSQYLGKRIDNVVVYKYES